MTSSFAGRTALAVCAFLLTSLTNVTAPLFAMVGIIATVGLFKGPSTDKEAPSTLFGAVLLLALVIGGLIAEYQDLPFADPVALTMWLGCAAAGVLVPGWAARRDSRLALYVLLGLVLLSTSLIGARLIITAPEAVYVSDVFAFHEAASQTLKEGLNPYVTAQVVNTDPNVAPGTITTGYPYPPISMAAVVASSAWLGDSRWILLFCWVGAIAVLGARAISLGGSLLQSVLLLSLFPALRASLFVGWTELLILGVASLLVVGTEPARLSAGRTAALAALASTKQYMVFLAPLALIPRPFRVRLPLSILALTGATLLPYLLLDPASVYHALYENLAAIGDRPDSFSISGMLQALGIASGGLPRVQWIAMTLLFGCLIARRVRHLGDFCLGTALVLGFAFLTGVAFVNYWLLCAGLVVVGATLKADQRSLEKLAEHHAES